MVAISPYQNILVKLTSVSSSGIQTVGLARISLFGLNAFRITQIPGMLKISMTIPSPKVLSRLPRCLEFTVDHQPGSSLLQLSIEEDCEENRKQN